MKWCYFITESSMAQFECRFYKIFETTYKVLRGTCMNCFGKASRKQPSTITVNFSKLLPTYYQILESIFINLAEELKKCFRKNFWDFFGETSVKLLERISRKNFYNMYREESIFANSFLAVFDLWKNRWYDLKVSQSVNCRFRNFAWLFGCSPNCWRVCCTFRRIAEFPGK